MKTKTIIKYSVKFYIVSFLLEIFCLLMSAIGFSVLLVENKWLWAIFYVLFFVIAVVGLSFTLYDFQWVVIDSTHISAYNIFGLVKKLELSKIKTVITTNVTAFGVKSYSKNIPCIVVSCRKSLRASEINDAYNKKKHSYVIFPDSADNRQILNRAVETIII